jgi:tetratricopeptide (TPR) repeat protein
MFKKPLSELIKRIADVCKRVADTKRISKTRDGLTAEFLEPRAIIAGEQGTEEIDVLSEGQQAVSRVEQANRYEWLISFNKKDYQSAIKQIDEEIEKTGKDIILELLRALCYYKEKGFVEGIREFETIINKYPNESEPYIWLSYRYSENRLLDKAIDIVDRGLPLVENKVALLQRKGEIYVQAGQTVKALGVAEDIVSGGIDKPKGYLLMVSAYEKEGGKEEKVDLCYRRALKEDPTNEETLKTYASYLYDKERKESSLVMYRKLIDLFPESQGYWTLLGNVYLDLGFYDKALVSYEKAHLLSEGKEAWIIENIGNLYKNKGLYTKSIEYLREAILVDNSSEYGHNRLSGAIESKNEETKRENEIIEKKEKEIVAGLAEEAIRKEEENLTVNTEICQEPR